VNARALLPLLLLLAALTLAAPAFAAAPAERRYPVAERRSGGWPRAIMLQVVRSPDWSDADVYPRASRRLEQEGDVGIDLLVGTDGVPGACRVWLASRHVELDDSTCDLGMTMRFARLAAPSVYRARLTWRLSDSSQFGAGRLVARLETWAAVSAVAPSPPSARSRPNGRALPAASSPPRPAISLARGCAARTAPPSCSS